MKKAVDERNHKKYYLSVSNYPSDRLYISITCGKYEDLFADLTIDIPKIDIADKKEIFLSNDISTDMKNLLIEKGIISKPTKTVGSNMGIYQCVEVNFDVLKEYDPKGVEDFSELHNKKENKSKKKVAMYSRVSTYDKNKNLLKHYNKDEIVKLLEKDERLVYVDTGKEAILVKYKDLPDVIVDINNKYGFINLTVNDYERVWENPLLTTCGYFLDRCNSEVRNDIIDRLIDLQNGNVKLKNYKVIDEEMLKDAIKFIEEKEDKEMER